MNQEFWDGRRAKGIPDRVDTAPYDNIPELIQSTFKKHPKQPAFTSFGHTLNYAEIDRLSENFCRYLNHHTHLKPGDRIAIQMANLLQYPVVLYGALKAGLIIVNTNPLYTEHEMQHLFNDANVKALVFMTNFGDKVERAIPNTSIEYLIGTDIGDLLPAAKRLTLGFVSKYIKKMVPRFNLPKMQSFRNVLEIGKQSPPSTPVKLKSSDIALLQYTGGTTGVAKGAMLSHGNLIANAVQISGGLAQILDNGEPVQVIGKEIISASLPLYHIYAFTMNLILGPLNGQHSILIANPRDSDSFIKALKPWKISIFLGINTLFILLMNNPKFKKLDFSGLKATASGGAALATNTNRLWNEVTGCDISEGYGLTECSPAVSANACGGYSQPLTVGLPMPNTAFKVIDEDGAELPIGEAGELCVKGPQVMQGYWNHPKETAEALDKEGWFKTGDIGTIDENGIIKVVDRLKDMVIVSGFNVYPNEIEDVVLSIPGVLQAAVIGVADEKTGEAVKLYVTLKNPELTEKEIIEHCRKKLTSYKIPKLIEFRDQLPISPIGKILRKDLRNESLASVDLS